MKTLGAAKLLMPGPKKNWPGRADAGQANQNNCSGFPRIRRDPDPRQPESRPESPTPNPEPRTKKGQPEGCPIPKFSLCYAVIDS